MAWHRPAFGTTHAGRVAYSAGYSGLGVGATRFGAAVQLGLLYGRDLDLTSLDLVRRKPLPFPPERIRYAGIQLTRWSLAHADPHDGHRNLWLRTLDRLGLTVRAGSRRWSLIAARLVIAALVWGWAGEAIRPGARCGPARRNHVVDEPARLRSGDDQRAPGGVRAVAPGRAQRRDRG